jgi:hypothetical protein
MSLLHIDNDGPLIVVSNYWESEPAQAGYFTCRSTQGAFRLLIPQSQRGFVSDMRRSDIRSSWMPVVSARSPWLRSTTIVSQGSI